MIVVMVVMVAQRVFASQKQCACTDSYRQAVSRRIAAQHTFPTTKAMHLET